MPLVCPFWSDYVKSIEVCPSVVGGEAHFIGDNWDGSAPYFYEMGRYSPLIGGPWVEADPMSPPSAFSGTPSEVWGTFNSFPPVDFTVGIVVRFFGSVAAEGIPWTMENISGSSTFTNQGVDTLLDLAYLKFHITAAPGEGEYINVIEFTPLGGTPLTLNLMLSSVLS